jgi:miniconductance mechanosensitive channel
VAALLLAILIGWGLRALASVSLAHSVKPSGPWHDALKRFRVWPRTTWVMTTIAARILVLPLLEPRPAILGVADKALDAFLVFTVTAAISGSIGALVEVLEGRESGKRLPLKALGQALQMAAWTYASVAMLSVLTGRDVASVLTGLTAIGAVLVYVFRDPILGWTAGVQIAANDLVREDDWITVPQRGADGKVEDISLTTVKVRNWDKTVTSIPSYSLFSEGFRNWRGMYDSGGRRIKRAIAIDASSVRFLDETLFARLNRSPLMLEIGLKSDVQQADADPLSSPQPTNLSCFRAWLEAWLKRHPKIHEGMTSMVRELEPDGRGIPVEIYVFSNDQRWAHYEKLQAEILDHVLAVLPLFDLRVFQEPTGRDLRAMAANADRVPEAR